MPTLERTFGSVAAASPLVGWAVAGEQTLPDPITGASGGTTTGVIYSTVDGGVTWTRLAEMSDRLPGQIVARSSQELWMLAGDGLAVSHDGGHTWSHDPTADGISPDRVAIAGSSA